ncbi:hypothetical protein TASIC1_0001058400 [Trichoderma asperellum]|uniref:Uncharacterized protein n=1 Tax=Trichoderma asperellum TaxID=101201 RepID=A0A6V8QJU9_TRIAP|nr:hypothetical protein TASIC1_0001058400 [Trichoderma asperellum]
MADEDTKTTLDVPQVSVSNNEAPSTQQSQGHDTPQRDVVMADVPTDQASPVDWLTASSSHQHPQLLHQVLLLAAREHQRTALERLRRIQILVLRCLQRRPYMVTRHGDT